MRRSGRTYRSILDTLIKASETKQVIFYQSNHGAVFLDQFEKYAPHGSIRSSTMIELPNGSLIKCVGRNHNMRGFNATLIQDHYIQELQAA